MLAAALRVGIVAVSLALDVFAVAIGVGIQGVERKRVMLRIGAAFACAEVSMNVVGAALGSVAGKALGDRAGYLGFAALIGVGIFMLVEALRNDDEHSKLDLSSGAGLALASLSISLDSLGIGFSIVYIGVPIVVTLATIGTVSITATFLGIYFGKRLGTAVGASAGLFAGIVLALTGAGFAAAKFYHLG